MGPNGRNQTFPCGHFSRYQKLIFTMSYFWYQQNKASSRLSISNPNLQLNHFKENFLSYMKKKIPIHEIEIAPFQSSNVYHIQMLMLSDAWLLSLSFVIFTRSTPKKKLWSNLQFPPKKNLLPSIYVSLTTNSEPQVKKFQIAFSLSS